MQAFQNAKVAILYDMATAATNGTATSNAIDTLGAHDLKLCVWAESTQVTTALTTLKVQESDTTDATNYADVTGLVGGTNDASGFTIQAVPSASPTVVAYNFNIRKVGARKRYFRVLATPAGTGQTFQGFAVLSGSGFYEMPNSASETGSTIWVNVL